MRTLISLVFSSLLIVIFSSISLAAPFLHDPQPMNNSYTKGGTITLAINITDDMLNVSSGSVKMIEFGAYQQGEEWVTENLVCSGGPIERICSIGFVTSTIGSDTIELFYFEASNTTGATGYNGTASNPLRFTLDRNPPVISFTNPINNSYVNGNETISITVADASSGADNNTVQYSLDNSSWITLRNTSLNSFEAIWNTALLQNNQTVTLYARASDNVRNNASVNINVTVDNEIPQIVVSPLTGTLSGNVQLQANVSDNYSGINLVKYVVGSLSGTLGCTGNNYSATCSAVINTAVLQDGNHTLTFTVTDRAGNSNTSSIQIKTSNTQPAISIIEPVNNAIVKGTTLVKANIANAAGIITSAELSIEREGNKTIRSMICNSNFTSCNYSLDTTSFADGGYTIKARAANNLNLDISSSISVTFDNTKPSLAIVQPTADVKGDFEIKVDVIDANLNQNKVVFNISSFNGNLSCTPQTPSKYICSTVFNSRQLSDGKYTLNISAEDKAGNLAIVSKEIIVANQPTTSSGQSTSTGTGGTPSIKENKTIEKEQRKPFLGITLPFKGEYIILGVVISTVVVIVIILVLIVIHRSGKPIITEDRI